MSFAIVQYEIEALKILYKITLNLCIIEPSHYTRFPTRIITTARKLRPIFKIVLHRFQTSSAPIC